MAAEWYYTTNKTQMGPVSWTDLRELAEVGILKPHDLVWSDGMAEWVKAINQQGLFADDAGTDGAPAKKKASYDVPKPPPARRSRRTEEEDDDDEDERDSKKSKERNRKRDADKEKTGVGIKIGLILGGVLFFLLLMGCGAIGLVWLSSGGGGGGNQPVPSYTVNNLAPNRFDDRTFKFRKGQRVIITSTNNTAFNNTDVDLRIFRGNDAIPFVFDDRLPQQDRNCRVDFVIPDDGNYRVRIANLGPGTARSCTVRIDQP